MPRTARSRSALGATTAALLPPSSSSERPRRAATRGATSLPMRVEPVAETSGTRGSSTSASPTSRAPSTTCERCSGAPVRRAASAARAWQASAVSSVFSDGFHTTASPQTKASAAFHDQTATGKLKALMTPTTPSGCHCSIIRWPGRSVAMVRPCSWRERPTARSQMSIISWTSPRPSLRILPASMLTRAPRSSLCSRSSSPSSRTNWPRTGAGTVRHCRNASWARPTASATSDAECEDRRPSSRPSMGDVAERSPDPVKGSSAPRRARMSRARVRTSLMRERPFRGRRTAGRRWCRTGRRSGCPPGRRSRRGAGRRRPRARRRRRRRRRWSS